MNQKNKVYIFIGAAVLILFLLFRYEFKKKAEGTTRDEQVYVEMPDADVKEVSTSKSHAYATFTDDEKNQDIEDYWTQCQIDEEQKKEEKKPLWQILFGGKKNEGTASENTVRKGDRLPTES